MWESAVPAGLRTKRTLAMSLIQERIDFAHHCTHFRRRLGTPFFVCTSTSTSPGPPSHPAVRCRKTHSASFVCVSVRVCTRILGTRFRRSSIDLLRHFLLLSVCSLLGPICRIRVHIQTTSQMLGWRPRVVWCVCVWCVRFGAR